MGREIEIHRGWGGFSAIALFFCFQFSFVDGFCIACVLF